jgi:predicted Ser/Thr protein kinase
MVMCVVTDGSERPLPEGATKISDNSISVVWRGNDGYIYKRSTPFLIENELFFLEMLENTGFVPLAGRYDKYTIRMEDLGESELPNDQAAFSFYMGEILGLLSKHHIRHGDLTGQSFVVRDNRPYVIDFAESRLDSDPRPDKRPEGDYYWLFKTTNELCAHLS